MRRIIETCLVLILSCLPLGSPARVAELLPLLLSGISLSYLVLFSTVKYLDYGLAAVVLALWFFFPDMYFIAPLLAYAVFQRDRRLTLLPLVMDLFPVRPFHLLIILLSLWLAYHEYQAREREKAYLAMRDDFVQNDLLQRRILKEEELNHQKNLEIAILKERNRISREIHDSVGHTISAGILQIEAMKLSAPEPLREKLGVLSTALSHGMEDVRISLHNLHNESISLKSEIEALTRPMATAYNIETVIQLDEGAPIEVKRAVISMLREQLTNIQKHSDGNAIKIIVRELPQHYTATVKDNGSEQKIRSGLGLASMEEMTRALGGVFSRGWSDGFFVHMTLPKPAGEAKRMHGGPPAAST